MAGSQLTIDPFAIPETKHGKAHSQCSESVPRSGERRDSRSIRAWHLRATSIRTMPTHQDAAAAKVEGASMDANDFSAGVAGQALPMEHKSLFEQLSDSYIECICKLDQGS